MKKRNILLLALLLALAPAGGSAQDLPELFGEVYQSIGEGLAQGAALAEEALSGELTLRVETDAARVEEGKSVRLTVTAGNPLPRPVEVGVELALPERLRASDETAWQATLPAAQVDETGALVPSVTAFTRELTLAPGGGSEQADVTCELSMGTRFYRAHTPLALCVPDVEVSAFADGVENSRVQPGDAFTYRIEVANAGDAPKDVALELTLPQNVMPAQTPGQGWVQTGSVICGRVYAEAAAGETPSRVVLTLPVKVAENALEGDEDARRLLSGALRADGKRVPLERIEVCGAKVSARLLADTERLEAGEETTLRVMVVNGGLAPADVRLSCVLPEGLTMAGAREAEATAAEAAVLPVGDDDLPGGGAAVPAQPAPKAKSAMTQTNGALVFDVHMEAAAEEEGGVVASTQVIEIPVVAAAPQQNLGERLVGASLAWNVGSEPTQMSEAVALRVVREEFMGLSREDWNGVFWAAVITIVTIAFLYAAVRKEHTKEDDFCCE